VVRNILPLLATPAKRGRSFLARIHALPMEPLSLRARLLCAFMGIILFVGVLPAFLGIGYIHRTLPRVQDVVAVDLNAAQEVYREYAAHIAGAIRLLAGRGIVKENLKQGDMEKLESPLQSVRQTGDLDLLIVTDVRGRVLYPMSAPGKQLAYSALATIVRRAIQQRKEIISTVVLAGEELAADSPELAQRARIELVSTPYSPAAGAGDMADGLMLAAAVPVFGDGGELLGVVCGGQLLNHRNSMVDRIRNNLYRQEKFDGRDVAIVSIFLGGKRIATSATSLSGERGVGTLVAEDVYNRVILKGEQWIKPGYIMDDWYLTAYEPIRGPQGTVIGALGLGLLERKFEGAQRRALAVLLALTVAAVLLSILISYFLSNSVLKPVNSLIAATQAVARNASPHEIALEHAPPEIQELGQAFNGMVSAIHERDRRLQRHTHEKLMRSDRLAMIGQLAAGVAHEINNPLGSILLFSRLVMQQAPAQGRMRENLERIEKETKRCHTIVKSLLDFARERKPLVEATDVNNALDGTLKLFEGQFLFQNVQIVRGYSAALPPIQGDQAQLQQVFMNIILNAVDAMSGKGTLSLTTKANQEEETVEIAVSDTGCGIAPENMERIFDPFFTTKGVGHGTGLGLSVSYGIVQSHNGDITVSNNPGGGATFTVSLPVKEGLA
jgi:two-component system NtrC family sensor kinase